MQCALISTYDKQGIVELVSALSSLGINIIATGGTYQHLKKAGIHAIEISDYTNFPEIMNGRVKSLHPKIYAGILARRNEKNTSQYGQSPADGYKMLHYRPFLDGV